MLNKCMLVMSICFVASFLRADTYMTTSALTAGIENEDYVIGTFYLDTSDNGLTDLIYLADWPEPAGDEEYYYIAAKFTPSVTGNYHVGVEYALNFDPVLIVAQAFGEYSFLAFNNDGVDLMAFDPNALFANLPLYNTSPEGPSTNPIVPVNLISGASYYAVISSKLPFTGIPLYTRFFVYGPGSATVGLEAVPEASTYTLVFGLAALVMVCFRRRLKLPARTHLAFLLASLAAAVDLDAQVTVYTDRAAFDLAAREIAPFELSDDLNDATIDGFTINSNLFTEVTNSVDGTAYYLISARSGDATITIDQPVLAFGFEINPAAGSLGTTLLYEIGSASGLSGIGGSFVLPATDITEFRGFVSATAFTTFTLRLGSDRGRYGLDNFIAYPAAPEPLASGAVLGLVALGPIGFRRRRARGQRPDTHHSLNTNPRGMGHSTTLRQ